MNKKEFKNALDHACIYMELQADDVAHDYLIEAFYDMQIVRYYTCSDENIGTMGLLKDCFDSYQKAYKFKHKIDAKDLKFI